MRDAEVLRLLHCWEVEGVVRWCDEVAPILADRLEELGDPLCGVVRRLLRQHVLPMPCGEGAYLTELVINLGDEDLEDGIMVQLCQVGPPNDLVIQRRHIHSHFGAGHNLVPRTPIHLTATAYLHFLRRPRVALSIMAVCESRHEGGEVVRVMATARADPVVFAGITAHSVFATLDGHPLKGPGLPRVWGKVCRV